MEDKSNIIQEAIAYKEKLEKEVVRLRQTLQEIKEIAKKGTKTEDYLLGQEYTDLVDEILQLITKAESEG